VPPGNWGGAVVGHLLRLVPASTVAACVREPEKARPLVARGVDVRRGNYDDRGSLVRGFAGAACRWRALPRFRRRQALRHAKRVARFCSLPENGGSIRAREPLSKSEKGGFLSMMKEPPGENSAEDREAIRLAKARLDRVCRLTGLAAEQTLARAATEQRAAMVAVAMRVLAARAHQDRGSPGRTMSWRCTDPRDAGRASRGWFCRKTPNHARSGPRR
jgi:hypothetical protein